MKTITRKHLLIAANELQAALYDVNQHLQSTTGDRLTVPEQLTNKLRRTANKVDERSEG